MCNTSISLVLNHLMIIFLLASDKPDTVAKLPEKIYKLGSNFQQKQVAASPFCMYFMDSGQPGAHELAHTVVTNISL